jgi:hypothetical protein
MKSNTDISQGINLGMYHLLVYLPSSISLPLNKTYAFTIKEKRIHALLHDNKWPVTIVDHSNELLFEEKTVRLKNPIFDFGGVVPQVIINAGEIMNVTEFINNSFREFYPSPCSAINKV